MNVRTLVFGFLVGAVIPLFWGTLAMMLFGVPEGPASRMFWDAVYFTCPFWVIQGNKALLLMPVLNGLLYSALFLGISLCVRSFARKQRA